MVDALETAAQNTPESREAARQSAVLTLRKLSSGEANAPLVMTMPVSELDVQLRTAAVAAGISYAFSQSADDGELEVPIEVADALVGAVTEAMDNSIRHASRRGDRPTSRSVRAARLAHGLEVIIKDDGPGFTVGRVGVNDSACASTSSSGSKLQPGATATVDSVRGRGTTVTLEWNENVR